MLFSLIISNLLRLLDYTRLEENIYICLHGVDHPSFLFELRTFIIEPLLLFKKSLLFRLQCLQARQFFIVLHGKYANLSRRLDEAVQRKVKFVEAMSEDNKWLTLMKSVSGATMLSQELVDESVELVKVHEDGSIELVMKYGDIYALTVQSIKEVQEAM